jgi:hypothetical protein
MRLRLTVEVHADASLTDIVAKGFDADASWRKPVPQDMVAVLSGGLAATASLSHRGGGRVLSVRR